MLWAPVGFLWIRWEFPVNNRAAGLRPGPRSCSAARMAGNGGASTGVPYPASEGPIPPLADRGRLVVARHGQTEWSRSGRHTGRTDLPLLAEGEAQARALGDRLRGHRFAAVCTSPRQRARRTCELAGFGDQAVTDPDLAEWDYGELEGLTTPEIRAGLPGWVLWTDGPPGGERLKDVAARADRVIAAARARAGDTLLFAHGHVLRVLAARWLGMAPVNGRHFALGPGALGILGWERAEPVVLRWNLGACDPLV